MVVLANDTFKARFNILLFNVKRDPVLFFETLLQLHPARFIVYIWNM